MNKIFSATCVHQHLFMIIFLGTESSTSLGSVGTKNTQTTSQLPTGFFLSSSFSHFGPPVQSSTIHSILQQCCEGKGETNDICMTGSTQLGQAMQCSRAPGSIGGRTTTNDKMTKRGREKNICWSFHCCSQERFIPLRPNSRRMLL